MIKYNLFKFIFFLCFLSFINLYPETIRVGIYQNLPKIGLDKNGKPCGIFVDIINEIAKHENWKIEWIYNDWDKCLELLKKDSIDIMPDVAYSEEREKEYDFNKISVLASWLQILSRKDVKIESIESLDGKVITVLEGSVQEEVALQIQKDFNISFKIIPLRDYTSTIRYVKSGIADGVIVSRFYMFLKERENGLIPTTVFLKTTHLHFATNEGKNANILAIIDKHISKMLNDPKSAYYKSLEYWLSEKPLIVIPVYLKYIIYSILIILIFVLFLSAILKWQVNLKTKELQEKNGILEDTLEKLKKAEEDAIKRERLYVLGQLASGIAHDFNNVLTPIMGLVDLALKNLKEGKKISDFEENLNLIKVAAEEGQKIAERMKKFSNGISRPEHKEIVDLNEKINEAIRMIKVKLAKLEKEGVHIKIDVKSTKDCRIIGMGSDIVEMILNLLLNSIDALSEGGNIDIITKKVNQEIILKITDNGTGMSEEVLEKCKDPFFTTKGEKGTGIGLTMVCQIVNEYNGEIDIKSSKGKGTEVTIKFPALNS